jgi:hypothetical protein
MNMIEFDEAPFQGPLDPATERARQTARLSQSLSKILCQEVVGLKFEFKALSKKHRHWLDELFEAWIRTTPLGLI